MAYQRKFITDDTDLNLSGKLPENEIRELFSRYRMGDEEAGKKIAEHNIRLVLKEASKFKNVPCEQEELIAEGMCGLVKSINTFDLDKNILFASYAVPVINNAILGFLQHDKKHQNLASIYDTKYENDDNGNVQTIEETLMDENAEFEDKIINKRYNAQIRKAMAEILTEKENTILSYIYGLDGVYKSQKDLGIMYGVSQSYISRLEKGALAKLRQKLDKKIDERPFYQKPKKEGREDLIKNLFNQYQSICQNAIPEERLWDLIQYVFRFLNPQENIESKVENALLHHLFQVYKIDPNNKDIKLGIYNLFQKKYPNLSTDQKIKVIQTMMDQYNLSEEEAMNLSIA